jgi:hypothetical protein
LNVGGNLDISGNVDISGTITCETAPSGGSDLTNKTYVDVEILKSTQILEYISSYCDGTTISVKNPINGNNAGTITTTSTTSTLDTNTTWRDIPGSQIDYCPPEGTNLVIYEFNFQSRPINNHKILSFIFLLDGSEITQARQGSSNYDHVTTGQSTFSHIKVPINVVSWSTAKSLKCQVRSLSNSHRGRIHQSAYWLGGNGIFVKPYITLIAIK